MFSIEGSDSPDIPVVGRRSARLSVIIPITIKGVARNGTPFKENTWTISVNKQGARLFAFHEPSVGDEVAIENPVLGRTAKARVVRVCEKRFPEDPYEIAIELTDAQNVWGVKFPPEDWQKEKPTPPPARGPAAAPGAPRTEANQQLEKFTQFNLAMTGLSRFARQAGEGAGKEVPPGEEKPPGPSGQAEILSPAYYQEALRLLEDKVKKIHSLEQDLESLLKRLEDSRAEVELSLTKIHDTAQQWSADTERIRRDVKETAEQALASSLEKAKLKIQEDIASASSVVTGQAQKRLQDEIPAAVESLLQTAETRLFGLKEEALSTYSSEFQIKHAELTEKANGEIRRLTETHAVSFSEKLKTVAEEISLSLCGQVEKSLESAAQSVAGRHLVLLKEQAQSVHTELGTSIRQNLHQAQQEVQEQVTNAEEELRLLREQEAEVARVGIAQSLQEALQALKKGATEGLAELETGRQKLELNSHELLEDFRKHLAELSTRALDGSRNYTETRLQGLRAEVEEAIGQAREKGFQEASDRFQKASEEALRSSLGHLQQATNGELQRIREGLAASEKEVVDGVKKQLVSVGQSTLESLLQDAKTASEEYRAYLRKVSLEFREGGEQDLVARLQSTLDGQRATVIAQFQKEATAARDRLSAEVKTQAEQMVQEASDTMYKHVGVAAVTIKSWSEDARAQLENYFQKFLAERLEQIGEFSRASLSAYRSELRTLTAEFSRRLENASRLLQGLETGPPGAISLPPTGPGEASPGTLAGPAGQP